MKKILVGILILGFSSNALAASVTVTVPDNKANKVYDAFDRAYNDPTENPSNSQKIAFVKSKLLDYIKEIVYADERNNALTTAVNSVVKDEDVAS